MSWNQISKLSNNIVLKIYRLGMITMPYVVCCICFQVTAVLRSIQSQVEGRVGSSHLHGIGLTWINSAHYHQIILDKQLLPCGDCKLIS